MTDANLAQNGQSPRCSQMVNTDLWHPHRCTRKAAVCRDGGWFCKQHDPQVQEQKAAARHAVERMRQQEHEDTKREAIDILGRLGVEGNVHEAYNYFLKRTQTYRAVVISFEDAEALAVRLNNLRTAYDELDRENKQLVDKVQGLEQEIQQRDEDETGWIRP